jgi:hypothetical protein
MSKSFELRDSERPEFFERMPVSPKKKPSSIFFVESSGNIHIQFEDIESPPIRRKPILRRRPQYYFPTFSVLGKRKLEVAFGLGMNDKERYGQEIPPNFFKTNVGHNAFTSRMDGLITPTNIPFNSYKNNINYWREKYQKKR